MKFVRRLWPWPYEVEQATAARRRWVIRALAIAAYITAVVVGRWLLNP